MCWIKHLLHGGRLAMSTFWVRSICPFLPHFARSICALNVSTLCSLGLPYMAHVNSSMVSINSRHLPWFTQAWKSCLVSWHLLQELDRVHFTNASEGTSCIALVKDWVPRRAVQYCMVGKSLRLSNRIPVSNSTSAVSNCNAKCNTMKNMFVSCMQICNLDLQHTCNTRQPLCLSPLVSKLFLESPSYLSFFHLQNWGDVQCPHIQWSLSCLLASQQKS